MIAITYLDMTVPKSDTTARNEVATQAKQQGRLTVTSAWRNPERNEAVGGVMNSRHQFGGAVDVKPLRFVLDDGTPVEEQALYCLLEHTAERMLALAYGVPQTSARQWAISEDGAEPVRCQLPNGAENPTIDHVHVQTY